MKKLIVLFCLALISLIFTSYSKYKEEKKSPIVNSPTIYSEQNDFINKYWLPNQAIDQDTVRFNYLPDFSFKNTLGDSVIRIIDSLMGLMNSTRYSNSRYIVDLKKGMMQLDCSYWVKQVITRVSEPHYNCISLNGTLGSSVLARDYYSYLKAIPKGGIDKNGLWMRVDDISNAKPGDIIGYKYDNNYSYNRTGHVMIVYSNPIRSTGLDTTQFCVYISDSASSGHAEDTRNKKGQYSSQFFYESMPGSGARPSGVGIGKMWFNTGEKSYFRWNYCDGKRYYNDIVIGRMISNEIVSK